MRLILETPTKTYNLTTKDSAIHITHCLDLQTGLTLLIGQYIISIGLRILGYGIELEFERKV